MVPDSGCANFRCHDLDKGDIVHCVSFQATLYLPIRLCSHTVAALAQPYLQVVVFRA
jgi:hypothetical protein